MSSTLLQYARDSKGRRVGAVLALVDGGNKIRIGWSRCKTTGKERDKFTRIDAVGIAKDRALSGTDWSNHHSIRIPHDIRKLIEKMKDRASKYFKQAELPMPPQQKEVLENTCRIPLDLFDDREGTINDFIDSRLDVIIPVFNQFGWSYCGSVNRDKISAQIREYVQEGIEVLSEGKTRSWYTETGRIRVEVRLDDADVIAIQLLIDAGEEFLAF